jgi:hypothetical protein
MLKCPVQSVNKGDGLCAYSLRVVQERGIRPVRSVGAEGQIDHAEVLMCKRDHVVRKPWKGGDRWQWLSIRLVE